MNNYNRMFLMLSRGLHENFNILIELARPEGKIFYSLFRRMM